MGVDTLFNMQIGFHPNGKLYEINNLVGVDLHGWCTVYDTSGTLWSRLNYDRGVLLSHLPANPVPITTHNLMERIHFSSVPVATIFEYLMQNQSGFVAYVQWLPKDWISRNDVDFLISKSSSQVPIAGIEFRFVPSTEIPKQISLTEGQLAVQLLNWYLFSKWESGLEKKEIIKLARKSLK